MIDATQIGADTWISLGTAVIVLGYAVKGTRVVTLLARDVEDMKKGMVDYRDFKVWTSRLARKNPTLHVPELDEDDEDA